MYLLKRVYLPGRQMAIKPYQMEETKIHPEKR